MAQLDSNTGMTKRVQDELIPERYQFQVSVIALAFEGDTARADSRYGNKISLHDGLMTSNTEYRELFNTFRNAATSRNIAMDGIAKQSSNGLSRTFREWSYKRSHEEESQKLREIPQKLAKIAFGF